MDGFKSLKINMMRYKLPNTKAKKTREEKLIAAKLRRRNKYKEIKNDPVKYSILKEKERLRYIKRKDQKKIKNVAEMTPREKRLQRKKWKENSRRYLEKKKTCRRIQQLMIENTPPTSDREDNANLAQQIHNQQDPLEGTSNQIPKVNDTNCMSCKKKNKLIKKLRYNYTKQIRNLKQEKEKIEKEKNTVKRMLAKMINRNRITQAQTLSTEKKIDALVETVDSKKREKVKKKLLFGEIIHRNLSEEYSGLKKGEKRVFSNMIMKSKESLKRHKILGKTTEFTVRTKIPPRSQYLQDSKSYIQQQIEIFFKDDSNTKISPEKNEFIIRNGLKKQKRYLTDTLANLHKKILTHHNSNVGYSTFCKYRPFWVFYPKESNRNTCACKIHVNFNLLVKSLNRNRIVKEANATALIKKICCDVYNEKCLLRTCEVCKTKVINFQEFDNRDKITFYEWCVKKESYTIQGKEKTKIINIKRKTQDYPKNIIKKLQKSLSSYFNHCANIVTQNNYLKTLKATLTPLEAIVHLDFSENYSVKFHEEIQSFHFGGNRAQITLHTSVVYIIDQEIGIMKPYSVCSISDCNKHDAKAIWAHLIPLLSYIQEISPLIDTIHFISDSPSSQYRNRYMFFIITQLQIDFPGLKSITWNYLEAGHRKGAPDGVGAVLKRTADQVVRLGKDIDTIEEFQNKIQSRVKNIKLLFVSERDIEEKKLPITVPPFKGTMAVHQVLWSSNSLRMSFRKLSCFFCENDVICSHGHHLGFVDLPSPIDNESVHLDDFLDKNTTGSFFREVLNSFYQDTAHHTALNQTQEIPYSNRKTSNVHVTTKTQASIRRIPRNKTVTLLSDVKLRWTNQSFIKEKKKNVISNFQNDFESFVAGNREKEIEKEHNKKLINNETRFDILEKETDENAMPVNFSVKNVRYEQKTIGSQVKEIKRDFFWDSSDDDIF